MSTVDLGAGNLGNPEPDKTGSNPIIQALWMTIDHYWAQLSYPAVGVISDVFCCTVWCISMR